MFKTAIADAISKELGLDAKEIEEKIEKPPAGLADFAFPCFGLVKQFGQAPDAIAKHIVAVIEKTKPELIEKVEASGGYVNFFLSANAVAAELLPKVLKEKENFGSSKEGLGKTIVIDFSSPNIAKPFGIGHLRSTVIGNALKQLYKFLGYSVVGINYLGDWGTHLGAVIYAYKRWGDPKKLKRNPLRYLLDLYVKFHSESEANPELEEHAREEFKALEQGDSQALQLWAKLCHASIDAFKKVYGIFGITFESWAGESFYNDKIAPVEQELRQKGLLEESEGALVVKFKEMPALLFRKADGTTTYASRELASLNYRIQTYKPEKILYVVGSEQSLHFQQVFETAKLAGWKGNWEHVAFGLYLAKGGGKLATRAGTSMLLAEIYKEIFVKAKAIVQEKSPGLKAGQIAAIAKAIAVAALIFSDLVNERVKDVVFDIDKALEFEGDTGPFLQYTNARANSILAKARTIALRPTKKLAKIFETKNEKELLLLISEFPSIVKQAAYSSKPHILAQYLLKLAREFNTYYHLCPIIKAGAAKEAQKARTRLALVAAVRQALSNGLRLLGIAPLKRM